MFLEAFRDVIFYPIYNALAALTALIPTADVGIAVVIITILVKLVLLPIALKASYTQRKMKTLEPQLKEIREKLKDKTEELAKKTLEVYKKNGVNPFSSILLVLIQIPVILGLYFAVSAEKMGAFNPSYLYSITPHPETVNYIFLGLLPLHESSIVLSVLVAVTQFVLAKAMMPVAPQQTGSGFQDDLAASMHIQVRYVLPVMIGGISYALGSFTALYFLTSNIFGIMQEYVSKKYYPV